MIAFKGDPFRGDQIIELLKLLGGISPSNLLEGTNSDLYYYISSCGLIECTPKYRLKNFKLYTIDTFPFIINPKSNLKKWCGKINITIK